jgi:hypothetical protein
VPTDLDVEMGARESDLDLDSLALTGLDLEMGAGETTVDLTGDYARDFDASIEGGVGEATVLVPRSTTPTATRKSPWTSRFRVRWVRSTLRPSEAALPPHTRRQQL